MKTNHRIMFVCHGNICRSPMAQFVFLDMVKKEGREADFVVSSSATSTEEIYNGIGSPIYPPVKQILKANNIPFADRRAVLLTREDYDNYDLFIGMDSANVRNMYRIFGGDPRGKIKKLMEFTNNATDVSDPWYTRRFDLTFDNVSEGCRALLKYIDWEEN